MMHQSCCGASGTVARTGQFGTDSRPRLSATEPFVSALPRRSPSVDSRVPPPKGHWIGRPTGSPTPTGGPAADGLMGGAFADHGLPT